MIRTALFALALLVSVAAQSEPYKAYMPSQFPPRAVMGDDFEELDTKAIGSWAMAIQIITGYADFYVVNGETFTSDAGTRYLVVQQAFSSSGTGLLRFTDYGKWLLLFNKGTSNYNLYEYAINDDLGVGLYWLYPTTGSPTGAGSWLRGFRFADAPAAPAGAKAGSFEAEEEWRMTNQPKDGLPLSDAALDEVHALASAMDGFQTKRAARESSPAK